MLQMCEKLCATNLIFSISMHIQNLVTFYQLILKILNRNETMTDGMFEGQNDRQSIDKGKDQEWIQSSTTPDPGHHNKK